MYIRMAFVAILLLATLRCGSPDRGETVEWRYYGNDAGGMRFSSLEQINISNISDLKEAWVYRTGELELMAGVEMGRPAAFECTPLMVHGTLYISTPSGRVIALKPDTGAEVWSFDPQSGAGTDRVFAAHRGVAFWEGETDSKIEAQRRIFSGTATGKLFCLDAETGAPCTGFGHNGAIDLRAGFTEQWEPTEYSVTSPPVVYKDLIIVGASVPEGPSLGPSGDVRAFSAATGDPVWRFHTVPHPGEAGHDTWKNESWRDRTGANVWTIMSVDLENGLVFLPVGSPAYDFYGGDREGQNLFGNALVALDALTGRLVWHFQAVHHDIWDYDLPAQPNLLDIQRKGETIPAVAQVTKMGFIFILNRLTGEPIFPIEEQAVPQSPVPGEKTWPTQPFPVESLRLSRYGPLSAEELSDLTPEHRDYCRELFDSAVSGGVYMPAGLELTLSFPGTLGGATWSGASYDPSLGYLFINTNEVGRIARMASIDLEGETTYRRTSPWGAYARFWDENQWPCQQPPWGLLNAVDLKTGKVVWAVPLGGVRTLEQQGIIGTGAPNLGGSIVTAGGLVFIAGTNDRRFRAFSARDGVELWSTDLEASGHATPMTYLGQDGRQYVVIAAGGGGSFSPKITSDTLVAFTLP